ncbi:hypothetical protein EUX98_g9444 [Antrodiella citrinella]|uniref:RNase H type-1 domain-containing protein n=1 Tax=Antrodiella citrinella TaxID=2447956 RepID=A0A4S4LTL2_9APHY|nr:hypothetical protein EUX98_g9444 [Antrodiella citrinella]
MNTVQIFDSFRASTGYNTILLSACDILINSDFDLRVWHIPGATNTIADALSRGLFSVVHQYAPSLQIFNFIPPQCTLGEPPS